MMCLCASVSQERDMQNRYETRSVVCVKQACTSETRFSFLFFSSNQQLFFFDRTEEKKRRSGSALPFVQLVSRAGFTSPSVSNKSVMPARLHRRVFFFPAKEYSTMPASGREPSPIGPAQSLERPSNSFVASATETWSRELVLLGRMPTSTANFTIVRAKVVMLGKPHQSPQSLLTSYFRRHSRSLNKFFLATVSSCWKVVLGGELEQGLTTSKNLM